MRLGRRRRQKWLSVVVLIVDGLTGQTLSAWQGADFTKTETINQSVTYFPDPVLEMPVHLRMEFFRNIEKSPFYEKANKSIKQPGKAAPHLGYLSYASHLK